MKLKYYKDPKGNFGDDLNPWLWEKILKNNFWAKPGEFYGVGSILSADNVLKSSTDSFNKIVFGSGYRPSYNESKLTLDKHWSVRFLRGPLSSFMLGNCYSFITDAAYCLRHAPNFQQISAQPKKYNISLMPYFKSLNYFNWQSLCDELGYHYISPLAENGVEYTINEIASSNYLITEAMHGAIVADLLRVPWHRFILTTPYTEHPMVSQFKWNDWLMSVNVIPKDYSYIKLYRKTKLNDLSLAITNKRVSPEFLLKKMVKRDIINNLSNQKEFTLSSDSMLLSIEDRLAEQIHLLNSEKSIFY